jgi:hypothetical protein
VKAAGRGRRVLASEHAAKMRNFKQPPPKAVSCKATAATEHVFEREMPRFQIHR